MLPLLLPRQEALPWQAAGIFLPPMHLCFLGEISALLPVSAFSLRVICVPWPSASLSCEGVVIISDIFLRDFFGELGAVKRDTKMALFLTQALFYTYWY